MSLFVIYLLVRQGQGLVSGDIFCLHFRIEKKERINITEADYEKEEEEKKTYLLRENPAWHAKQAREIKSLSSRRR